jgi:hypothetical protein
LRSSTSRILRTSNVAQVTQYIKLKYDLLQEHNVFERMQRLDHPGNRDEYAERLDKDILSASLAAEKQMKRYASPAWSLKLVAARKKVTYWSICISMLKTGLDQTDQLKHLQSSSPFGEEEFSVTTTLHECTAKLRASKAAVDQIVKDSFARRDTERAQKITELESSVLQAD